MHKWRKSAWFLLRIAAAILGCDLVHIMYLM